MKRLTHLLLTTDTWVVDFVLWWKALNWFLTFLLIPSSSFATLARLAPMAGIKWVWLLPAAVAAVLPVANLTTDAVWIANVHRIYALSWWMGMLVLLLVIDPTLFVFWGGAVIGVAGSMWTLVRQTSDARHAVRP